MGNFLIVPSLQKKLKKSDRLSSARVSSIGKINYEVRYESTVKEDLSLWVTIKQRRNRSELTNRIRTTRYNILTFLPKNLFEQFHRVANVYFAILIALNWVPVINAISKTVAFIPLTVILVITGVKDLVEDLKRWRSDVHINRQISEVYNKSSKEFIRCQWQDLSVGDIIRVRADQTVPADILLISSTSCESTCYLDTAAIDGESNLKQKLIPSAFLNISNPEKIDFQVQCDPPNDDIYRFNGRVTLSTNGQAFPCDNNNILLRGCVLRITEYVDGLIIYAGNQTKVIKSSNIVSSKHAQIERYINRDVLFSSTILVFLCLLSAGLSLRWERSFDDQWMFVPFLLEHPITSSASHFFVSALRFIILFQVMVPIALYVSLDIVRVLQIYGISKDKNLKYERPITCRTFTINEDLGQIGYVFSDKTGTITQNQLLFKKFSIGGFQYSHRSQLPSQNDSLIHHFLTALAVCNSSFIVGEHNDLIPRIDYRPKYEGDNADDLVLCQAASDFGVRMISRTARTIVVRYMDADETKKQDTEYEVLCLIPFDSSRRRMSIIVRADHQIYMYIKGAESALTPFLIDPNDEQKRIRAMTDQHSSEFADQGYRSLLVAYRLIDYNEYEIWSERYRQAANALDDRETAIAEVASELERNLLVAGLTAVEDKLQEGVPHTIATLRCAGIKIWLLTGDKQATALSTAQAASLINISSKTSTINTSETQNGTPATTDWNFGVEAQAKLSQPTVLIQYRNKRSEINQQFENRQEFASEELRTHETIVKIGELVSDEKSLICLVVTGDDLNDILRYRSKEFIRVAGKCYSVLFCRVSAAQKRELVTIAKSIFEQRILCIGDGANDVGMIRESHCGVAVHGREGSQAVAAGDFAVDRFDCLRRLLLVHGAWCFTRMSELVLFTFMHNCAYVLVLFFQQIYNGYSGTVAIHSFYLILYTSLFSVLPQCASALFDQHISAERALKEPQLYQYTLKGKPYRIWSYWINILDAVWQSLVIYFVTHLAFQHDSDTDILSLGFSLVFSMMMTSMIHVLMQTTRINWLIIGSVVLSILLFFGFSLIFDAVCGRFWLTNLFIAITALLPRFAIKAVFNTLANPLR